MNGKIKSVRGATLWPVKRMTWVTATRLAALIFLTGTAPIRAQSQTAPDTVTLQRAVEISLAHHPYIEAARLGLEKEEALVKSAFDPGNTRLSYGRGKLNGSVEDYEWSISQEIKFPTVLISQARLQIRRTERSRTALEVARLDLERNTRSAWLQWAYGENRLKVISELETAYAVFAQTAEKRYRAGETHILEKLSATGQYQRIVQKKKEAESDVAIYCRSVQQWMNVNRSIALPQNALNKLTPPSLAGAVKIAGSPQVRIFEQEAAVAQQSHHALRHEFLPDIAGGYFNKSIEGTPPFGGVEISISMPLLFWAQTGKVQAAGKEAGIAHAEYENRRVMAEAFYQNRLQEFSKAREQLIWYEEQGLKISDATLFHAEKSYHSGAIGYVEYIQSFDQALTLRLEHLDALNLYNQTVTELQYLSGNFK